MTLVLIYLKWKLLSNKLFSYFSREIHEENGDIEEKKKLVEEQKPNQNWLKPDFYVVWID